MPTPKLLPIALALLLTACTTTQIDRQSNITLPENFQHTSQADSAPNLARWWQQWPDPQLGRLIEQGLQHNHSIAIARSRLEEARATARLAEADLLPSAGLAADAKGYRNHRRDPYLGNGGNLTSASFRAAWEPDIFGQKRSDADAARAAEIQARSAQLASAKADLLPRFDIQFLWQTGRIELNSDLAPFNRARSGNGGLFSIGVQLPLFTAGRIRANIQAADARLQTALLQYDQTLLQALADVDNAYQAQHALNAQQQELQQAERTAKQQVRNDRQLFRYGRKTLDTALQSQLSAHSFSQNLLDNQLASSLNLLNLYKAIGSGWQEEGTQPEAAEAAAK